MSTSPSTASMPLWEQWTSSIKQEFTYALTNTSQISAYIEPLTQIFWPNLNTEWAGTQVMALRQESDTCFTLVLKPHKDWKGFQPGQHIALNVTANGTKLSRYFSISSSPALFEDKGIIEVSIREQQGGRVTPWLRQLSIGTRIGISEAMGDFIVEASARPILMIAGGSGITPFRSYLSQVPYAETENAATLMYYASRSSDHLFADELKHLGKQQPVDVHLISSADSGRIQAEHIQSACPDFSQRTIYICGPNAMIERTQSILRELGVADQHMIVERFGPAPVDLSNIHIGGDVTFEQSGKTITNSESTLLNTADENHIPATSGCRMGICHKCKCHKNSGVVYNTLTQRYSDTGSEDIQLCVSIPVGDVSIQL